MRRHGAATIGALVVAAFVLTSCATAATPFQITGYAESGGTSRAQLESSAQAMTQVGIDGVNLTPDGKGVSKPDAASLRLLAHSHALHLQASLLFGNFSDSLGDFSDPLAERMLRSPANVHEVVADLVREVHRHHWDGITIDLESLNGFGEPGHTRDDNRGLDSFVTHLRAALGKSTLSICLSATTGSYADLGYDLRKLAANVDDIVLMAYDQHGPQWSKAGPVGGYPWVRKSLAGLMKGVPASRIQLGIGEYGYTWPKHDTGTNYSVAAMRALVKRHHATAHWSSTQREWYATFSNRETVWWSDARSYRARVALARSLHLGGVAVWSLGQGDPL